jgi:hypothetical protein
MHSTYAEYLALEASSNVDRGGNGSLGIAVEGGLARYLIAKRKAGSPG